MPKLLMARKTNKATVQDLRKTPHSSCAMKKRALQKESLKPPKETELYLKACGSASAKEKRGNHQ